MLPASMRHTQFADIVQEARCIGDFRVPAEILRNDFRSDGDSTSMRIEGMGIQTDNV